jgi:hypothetical protein
MNVHWCKRSRDIMQDWEVLYKHLEPEVHKTEITVVGPDFMFPLGVDKGFPTEKSFIVLQGEVNLVTSSHMSLDYSMLYNISCSIAGIYIH